MKAGRSKNEAITYNIWRPYSLSQLDFQWLTLTWILAKRPSRLNPTKAFSPILISSNLISSQPIRI
jgi:hypothetical protein